MFSFANFQRGSAVLQVCGGIWSLCKSCAHSSVVSVCVSCLCHRVPTCCLDVVAREDF